MITIVTLALDTSSQDYFEELRQRYYPPALNRIPAHVSLFHKLPGTDEVEAVLRETAAAASAFFAQVNGVRSLGRGVAFTLASPDLARVHEALSERFEEHLTPQDRQRFMPHIVVQNKATPAEAKELLTVLQAGFRPHQVRATGLLWWEYLGGPWRLLEQLSFARTGPRA